MIIYIYIIFKNIIVSFHQIIYRSILLNFNHILNEYSTHPAALSTKWRLRKHQYVNMVILLIMRQAPQIGEQLRNWGDISRLHPSPSKGNESWGYNMFLVLPQQTAWWGATPRNYQVTNPATADGWKMLERSRHLSGALFDCRGYCIIPFEEVSYFQEENAAWRNAQSITKHLQSHQKNALPGGLYHPVAEQARQQDNKKNSKP